MPLRRKTLAPVPSEVLGAVVSQKQDVAALFDELWAGSRSGNGVTRDTYGAGEQFAHQLIAVRAVPWDSRPAAITRPTFT